MYFRAHKHKKIADAVLTQVQPLLSVLDRFLGSTPTGLASDKYVLGFSAGTSLSKCNVPAPGR
jgi:hypothetical protein